MAGLTVEGDHFEAVGHAVGDIAEASDLKPQVEHIVEIAFVAFAVLEEHVVDAFAEGRQGNEGRVFAVIGLSREVQRVFCEERLLVKGLGELFPIEVFHLFQLLLGDLDDFVIRMFDVFVTKDGWDVFVRKLYLVECQVDAERFDMIDGVAAGTGVFGEGSDSFLTERQGLTVIVEVSAVIGVFVLLLYHFGRQFVDDVGILLVDRIFLHHGAQRVHVKFLLIEDAVDEVVALVVVVETSIFVVIEVVADELLIELQAANHGAFAVAEVGFGKVGGREPPQLGVPIGFNVISGGFLFVIVGYTVKQELEHSGLIVEVIGAFRIFKERHIVLRGGFFQCFHGFEGFGVMLVDEVEEGPFVPILHLHIIQTAVDGQVFVDLVLICREVVVEHNGDLPV